MNNNEQFTGSAAAWVAVIFSALVVVVAIVALGMTTALLIGLGILLFAVFCGWYFDPKARAEAEQTLRDHAGESAEDWREKAYGKLRKGGDQL